MRDEGLGLRVYPRSPGFPVASGHDAYLQIPIFVFIIDIFVLYIELCMFRI